MPRYKITIAYDGAAYSGWQIQPHATSVQETLSAALSIPLRAPVKLIGAGRTDAGVHARAQVAHLSWPTTIADPARITMSVNSLLPADIRVLAIELTSDEFHAMLKSTKKEYHYNLTLDEVQLPFERGNSWHVCRKVDFELLQKAAQQFVGTHDFTSFANIGSYTPDTIRTIYRLDVIRTPTGARLEFEGNGFLYRMVRNITGAVVEVATGRMTLEAITSTFAARDRKLAPMGAPAHGLSLVEVYY